MILLDTFLSVQLKKRENATSLRSLKQNSALIDFTSNDYLGLAQSSVLYDLILDKLDARGIKTNGATGSRLLSGNAAYTEEVEYKLADIFKSEASLIFNSGYTANLAVLSSLPQKGDTIIYDELAHTSIKDGARLSLANRFNFKHNDINDLEQKIKRSSGKVFIVVESIYSMDGDTCPLTEIVNLAEQYDAFIVLDEAHSTGVMGNHGSGMAVMLGLEKIIHVRVYTFGKAMGCHGACVSGSQKLIQYLINFARPFIYTTALPTHSIATIDCAFDYLLENISLQAVLDNKIQCFKAAMKNLDYTETSSSSIQAFVIPGNENVRTASHHLQNKGFDVRPILSPTVPLNSERLRVCLHTYNSDDEIKNLATLIIELTREAII